MRKKKLKTRKTPKVLGRGHVRPLSGSMIDNVMGDGSVQFVVKGGGHTFQPRRTQ